MGLFMENNKGTNKILTTHTPLRPRSNVGSAGGMHISRQKSRTLNRKFVKKPNFTPPQDNNLDGVIAKSKLEAAIKQSQSKIITQTAQTNQSIQKPQNKNIERINTAISEIVKAQKIIEANKARLAQTQKPEASIIKKATPRLKAPTLLSNVDHVNSPITAPKAANYATQSRKMIFNSTAVKHRQASLQRQGKPIIQPIQKPKNTPLYTTKNSPSQHTKNQTKQNQNTIHNPKDSDIYTEHPIAKVAQIRQAERKNIATNNTPVLKTARQIKEEVISEALANAPKQDRHQIKQPKLWGKAKLIGGLSAGLISAAAIAYTAYSQIPSFSMGIVNAQSGIQASYPGYIPGSFKVNGPIFGEEGRVQINFKSTTNDDEFKLVQVNSNWDSESLLTNYVKDKSKGHYQIDNERGISVYSYKNGGAWVSGGILHIIEGTAQLGPDQIKRIASSLK